MAPSDPAAPLVRRTTLDSGLVVVTEAVASARTSAIGLFGLSGSRDEEPGCGGLAHVLEHFVFRGTSERDGRPARSALAIARETDALGGDVDAWTDHEGTGYAVEVAADLLPRAIDLVADLVARPALPAEELSRELSVIEEELRSLEDSPEELVFEASSAADFGDHPLGRPVGGDVERVRCFGLDDVRGAWERTHRPGNLLACAAGRVEHDEVVRRVEAATAGLPAGDAPRGPAAPAPRRGVRSLVREHLEQAHVVLSLPGVPAGDAAEPVLDVLVQALGGGLSSRLWQRIREREGLAYDLSVEDSPYRDVGRLGLHVGCAPERVGRVLEIAHEELGAVRRDGLSGDELALAKEALASSLVLGLESPSQRMHELAWWQVVRGRHVTLEEQLDAIEAVGAEGVAALAERLLGDPARSLVVLWPEETLSLDETWLG